MWKACNIYSGKHGKFPFHNNENHIQITLCVWSMRDEETVKEKRNYDNADEPSKKGHSENNVNVACRNNFFLGDTTHTQFAYLNTFDNFMQLKRNKKKTQRK